MRQRSKKENKKKIQKVYPIPTSSNAIAVSRLLILDPNIKYKNTARNK